MNKEKLIQEMSTSQYTNLIRSNVCFNAIYYNIIKHETDEKTIIKLIANLCEYIEELNKLRDRRVSSELFPDGKFMND